MLVYLRDDVKFRRNLCLMMNEHWMQFFGHCSLVMAAVLVLLFDKSAVVGKKIVETGILELMGLFLVS